MQPSYGPEPNLDMYAVEATIQLSLAKNVAERILLLLSLNSNVCSRQGRAPGMCEHRFCSQTKTRGDRNCTACFSLTNIFNQSTNKSFGAKLQSEVTGGFTQVRIGNLINQSATSCAISIPPLLEDCSEQKTFKDVVRRRLP